jgi:hypothetical protein
VRQHHAPAEEIDEVRSPRAEGLAVCCVQAQLLCGIGSWWRAAFIALSGGRRCPDCVDMPPECILAGEAVPTGGQVFSQGLSKRVRASTDPQMYGASHLERNSGTAPRPWIDWTLTWCGPVAPILGRRCDRLGSEQRASVDSRKRPVSSPVSPRSACLIPTSAFLSAAAAPRHRHYCSAVEPALAPQITAAK